MLKDILNYMYANKDFSSKNIAKNLEMSEEVVDEYKNKLELTGYIKKGDCSSAACEKCSCGCNEKSLNPIIQWEFTDKALNLIKRK
ncbi:hypothetical protein UT300003_25480 [Clostridium sardiniense]